MIEATIIKDSINGATDDRLTTFVLKYPRFIHSEFMTHRALSRNAASTRAIPTKKIIQAIIDDPAMPVFWGKNQAGMQAFEELDDISKEIIMVDGQIDNLGTAKEYAKSLWLDARNDAIYWTEKLLDLGLHKQIAGRILEPWFNITVLTSATEWENFFALRDHPDAQPEIKDLATLMLEEYNKNIPDIKYPILGRESYYSFGDQEYQTIIDEAEHEDWHLPFDGKMDSSVKGLDRLKVGIARCARISYLTFDGEMSLEKDFAIYDRLLKSDPKHASPAEHPAFPIQKSEFIGNFKGWHQFRKLIPNENMKDSRVIKRRVVNGKVI